jgi:hypothetical protein
MSPEQLELWSDEVEIEGTLALFAEFMQWCARLNGPGLGIPLLKAADQGAVAFVRVFHEVVADFEEREGPGFRRELKEARTSDHLIEKLVSLRLLQSVISECRARRLNVPREILLLKAVIIKQILHIGRVKPRAEEPCAS